ncbi:MAG: lysophospholipase [Actinomycetia bacterium]|nr:lysophospholipase [Actinomycetes bacterium]
MPVAVPIVAGTAIRGVAATMMMRGVLTRHPNAFLITLASFGVTLPLHRSQEHIRSDIRKGLRAQGRAEEAPVVLVGHSQGGLAVLRYAIDNPDQVLHVIGVGVPWLGSRSAGRLTKALSWTGRDLTPGISDMAEDSPYLAKLRQDLPQIADKVTNIYSTHEMFIRPYTAAHIAVPGVTNILIAPEDEYLRHLQSYPQFPVDDLISRKTSHLGEMGAPEVRSRIWQIVDEVTAQFQAG